MMSLGLSNSECFPMPESILIVRDHNVDDSQQLTVCDLLGMIEGSDLDVPK